MQRLQHYFLATACLALMGSAGFVASAYAVNNCTGDTNCSLGANPYVFGSTDIFGGGSSLVAPYWRQISDCYANPADLITQGSSENSAPASFVDEKFLNYVGTKGTGPQNCATTNINNTETTWYTSTGSGNGISGVYGHDASTYWYEVNANGPQFFPEAFYGLSDAGLGTSDVNVYNQGGAEQHVTVSAPGGQSCNSGGKNPYPNPAQCYGPLVQFPFSIDPVAQFYPNKAIYEKVWVVTKGKGKETDYSFNVYKGTGNGGLRLSPTTYCAIWNGQITNWNDARLTADNNNTSLKSLKDPTPVASWSVPITPVGRSDSSGTTSIITRHLANVCKSFGYNQITTGATTWQAAGSTIVGSTYNVSNPNYPGVDVAGEITLAPNSSGVAQYVAFTTAPEGEGLHCGSATLPAGTTDCIQQARLGYVGPDYVMPFVKTTLTNTYDLYAAALENSSGNFEAPTVAGATAAFGTIQAPQSNKNGTYCSSCTQWGLRSDPSAWVQSLSPSSPLADPTGKTSYPLVGTTNFLGYTCYASSAKLANLVGQLNYIENYEINTDSAKGVLASAGLAPLPAQWHVAITQTFLNNNSGLGLNMSPVGTGTICSGSGIVGG
jgi:phosphate transport system substrate-binding protein